MSHRGFEKIAERCQINGFWTLQGRDWRGVSHLSLCVSLSVSPPPSLSAVEEYEERCWGREGMGCFPCSGKPRENQKQRADDRINALTGIRTNLFLFGIDTRLFARSEESIDKFCTLFSKKRYENLSLRPLPCIVRNLPDLCGLGFPIRFPSPFRICGRICLESLGAFFFNFL